QTDAEQRIETAMRGAGARPWRVGGAAVAIATMMQGCVGELRALEPPVDDRGDIERHFLGPLQAQADHFAAEVEALRRDLHRLRVGAVIRRVKPLDDLPAAPVDEAWCRDYGLVVRRRGATSPSFADRAAAVGVIPTVADSIPALSDEAMAVIRHGGSTRW